MFLSLMMINNFSDIMGMYIHIPFCVKKCIYCDFLSGPSDDDTRERYVQALIKELEASSKEFSGKSVRSIFFGGGTPSVLKPEQTGRIMEAVFKNYMVERDAEITTEANPGTLDYDRLKNYLSMGFNRLSIGVQSFNNHELEVLGRIHSYEDFLREYEDAVSVGFKNINIDLMSGIPDQTLSSWLMTLKTAAELMPQHISAYSLIIEEGTPLYSMYKSGRLKGRLADEDEEREMYHKTAEILGNYGYKRYEISNYSFPGHECRHNLSYWERINYAGLGVGASSLIDNVRYKNTTDVEKYIRDSSSAADIRVESENLSEKDCMEEFMFLGLRKTDGISIDEFFGNFGKNIYDVYNDVIAKMVKQRLLEERDGRIFLTDRGLDVSNAVMAEFLL